jgi:betaine-aldehyde dehydrogenase
MTRPFPYANLPITYRRPTGRQRAARHRQNLSEAGLPDGLFQIIHGTHEIDRAICEHPGIAKVSLTGGVATGKLIMSQSASTLKKITLELGGKSPLLVFDDCDFELAVQTALDANFYTAGEVCSNATRVFVQRSIADKFIAAMVDKPNAWLLATRWRPMSIWAR